MSNWRRILEQIERTRRAMNQVALGDGVNRVIRDAERMRDLTRPSGLDQIMREMEQVRQLSQQVASVPSLGAVGRIHSTVTSALDAAGITSERFNSIAARFVGDTERISEILRTTSPAFTSSMLVFEQLAPPALVLGTGSTMAAAMESLRQASDLSSSEHIRRFLDDLDQGFAEALDKAPADPRLRISWYRDLLSILLFVITIAHGQYLHHISAENNKEFQDRVIRHFEVLNDRLDELESCERPQTPFQFYLVERQGSLTEKPRPHSTVLRWLQPGELVWVVGRKGRWVEVQYVDSLDGSMQQGWVRKKYLTR